MASFIHSPKNTRRISSKVGKLKISSTKRINLHLKQSDMHFVRLENLLSLLTGMEVL